MLKRYDGTVGRLSDQSHRPYNTPKVYSKLIRRLAKKRHWTDLILVFQKLRERYKYTRSYG